MIYEYVRCFLLHRNILNHSDSPCNTQRKQSKYKTSIREVIQYKNYIYCYITKTFCNTSFFRKKIQFYLFKNEDKGEAYYGECTNNP